MHDRHVAGAGDSAAAKTPRSEREPALALRGITKVFGGTAALEDLSIDVLPGEIHGLIGPNGAGKTTAINVATGIYRPDAGSVFIAGVDVTRASPASRAASGLARTFQGGRLFGRMTVGENVRVAVEQRRRIAGRKRGAADVASEVAAQLDRMGLGDVAESEPRHLPFGRQKLVEVLRAFSFATAVLLLDEPTSGLADEEIASVTEVIRRNMRHLGVLLVEHNMDVVMSLCDRITVIDAGRWLATGTAEQIQNDPRVVEAYLGTEAA